MAFKKRKEGTLIATIDLLVYVASQINENNYVVKVIIDLRKAAYCDFV